MSELDDLRVITNAIRRRRRYETRTHVAELEAENERLKVCGNCHWMHCDFDDCTDDVDGELPGGCSPADPCHFTPSRWMRRDAS